MEFIEKYLQEAKSIIESIDTRSVRKVIDGIAGLKQKSGRLFVLGVGGGAAHASHAVNDFRKIADIESYCPSDNVSELTARINDEGWETSYVNWLRVSRLNDRDGLLIISVGGGDLERNISVNLVNSLRFAKEVGAKIFGIVGRDGGYTAKVADACVIIPSFNKQTVTAQTEAFQAVIWHLMVSHPKILKNQMKWESQDCE